MLSFLSGRLLCRVHGATPQQASAQAREPPAAAPAAGAGAGAAGENGGMFSYISVLLAGSGVCVGVCHWTCLCCSSMPRVSYPHHDFCLLTAPAFSGITAQLSEDSFSMQLHQLQPLLQANLEQQQLLQQQQQQLQQQQEQLQKQLQQQQPTPAASIGGVSDIAAPAGVGGAIPYPLSGYSASVQSFDDLGATDSAASSPRSRSSYAASSQHQPPSR